MEKDQVGFVTDSERLTFNGIGQRIVAIILRDKLAQLETSLHFGFK